MPLGVHIFYAVKMSRVHVGIERESTGDMALYTRTIYLLLFLRYEKVLT